MTHYNKSIALYLTALMGLEAYRAAVGLLVPAVAEYGNHVPQAIFPSSNDNFTGTHVCTVLPSEKLHATVRSNFEERHVFSFAVL